MGINLWRRTEPPPDVRRETAERVFSRTQVAVIIGGSLGLLVGAFLGFWLILVALVACATFYYLFHFTSRLFVACHSMLAHDEADVTDDQLATLAESGLPRITILVPHYREVKAFPGQLACLSQIDWPRDKLEVLVLVRTEDTAMLELLAGLDLPPYYRIVNFEAEEPKTKPNALNVGLHDAMGQYLIIYDAESRPEVPQLKKLWYVLRQHERTNVIGAMAHTLIGNDSDHWRAIQFASEYYFDHMFMRPGLARLNVLAPLPGNSILIDTAFLREIGGWDPFNGTEDADLGIRIALYGKRIASVNSTTWEEAPNGYGTWLNQRTRWMAGFMQTWLVYMRHPVQFYRYVGLKNFVAFHLLIGDPLVALLNPIFWALTATYIATKSPFIESLYPTPVFLAGLATMVIGVPVTAMLATAGALQGKSDGHVLKILVTVVPYWAMMSLAAWKAVYKLLFKPFKWDVTPHGSDWEAVLQSAEEQMEKQTKEAETVH